VSRVLHVAIDEGEVVARCLSAKVEISAIEGLPAGGTRLVCMSTDGAAKMRRRLKRDLIDGPVTRSLHRLGTPPL
jgi:hypothetical protein